MLMVLVTTFIAPPLLRLLITRAPASERATAADQNVVGEMTTEA